MENRLLDYYKKSFIYFLNMQIDFTKYDYLIENAGLYFCSSKSIDKNLNSKYFCLLNEFNLENLDDNYKNILLSKKEIDEESISVVKETYNRILKKDDLDYVMYNPPMPEHRVKNGSLVFEFVYGKNSKRLSGEQYLENMKKQRDFIEKVSELLSKEVQDKLGLLCVTFKEKRI